MVPGRREPQVLFLGEGALILQGVPRENKKEKGKEGMKTHVGDCTKKNFLKTTDWEKGECFNTTSFL